MAGIESAATRSRSDSSWAERVAKVRQFVEQLSDAKQQEEREPAVIIYYPALPLISASPDEMAEELKGRVLATAEDRKLRWMLQLDPRPDNQFVGYGTPYITAAKSETDMGLLVTSSSMLAGVHVYRLTTLWRAHEYADAFSDAFALGRILTAAACARSLLEGAAAFADSARKIIESWNEFKSSGRPTDIKRVGAFYDEFRNHLHVAQNASRIDGLQQHAPKATNVMTLIDKIAKIGGDHIKGTYHWLSDAVHGSFGSTIVYHVALETFGGGAVLVDHYACDPQTADAIKRGPSLADIIPDEALKAVNFAGELITADLQRMRWLIHDIGLTTEVVFRSTSLYPYHVSAPERNAPCPCGSGKKFKKCVHRWGESGFPPDDKSLIGGESV